MDDLKLFYAAKNFTKAYKAENNKYMREAMCLKEQFPVTLEDMREGDLFAGWYDRYNYLVKFFPQGFGTDIIQQSGYCLNRPVFARLKKTLPAELLPELEELLEYWESECTNSKDLKVWEHDTEMKTYIKDAEHKPMGVGGIITGRWMRMGGIMNNYDKLIRLGIPGLTEEITSAKKASAGDTAIYDAMLIALDVYKETALYYSKQAKDLASKTTDPQHKKDLTETARILERITVSAPESFREAMQLYWLYAKLCGVIGYCRMDEYLGDLYVKDIDSGKMDEEEAVRLLLGLYSLILRNDNESDGRIVLGGYGRRNPENADRFALVAMEATRRNRNILPTLTLRLYKGIDERLFKKALDVIGEGCLYPTLYNDDVYVDGVMRIMGIPYEDAIGYSPLGCGEMCIDYRSISSPNTAFIVPKVLEAVLHNGREVVSGEMIGLETGTLDQFDTFDKLYDAFKKQISVLARVTARSHKTEYETEAKECGWLFQSMLFGSCIEKGKSLVEGGAKYLGGCTEGFGFTNAADSLLVIKKLVYEEKKFTLEQLVKMLDANFEGYEAERKMMLDVPKYGNGNEEVDKLLCEISEFINYEMKAAGKEAGLDYYIISSVNPGGITHGFTCPATPDGRFMGSSFAVGNSPTAGRDKNGLTPLLTSVAKVDSANGGYITNLKLSPEMFTRHRANLEAMLKTFFKNGGAQLNITVVNRGDLEKAMVEPEKYTHVIVRVGGWAARFIDLDPTIKMEVLNRTQY